MLRHEHVGPKRKAMCAASCINGVRQPLTGALGRQEGKAVKTGKRQLMGMPRFIGCRPTHAPLLPVHNHSATRGNSTRRHSSDDLTIDILIAWPAPWFGFLWQFRAGQFPWPG